MKLNLESKDGKIKVGLGNNDSHAVVVTMSREAFAKIIGGCISGKRPKGDVRDFTSGMWQDLDLTKK